MPVIKIKKTILSLLFIILILAIGCSKQIEKPAGGETAKENFTEQIANPASVYCDEQGHNLEIRTNADGSQTGYCIFDNGTECEEWAFFRGKCPEEKEETAAETPEIVKNYP